MGGFSEESGQILPPFFFFKENKKLWAVTYISHICLAVGGVGSLPVAAVFC